MEEQHFFVKGSTYSATDPQLQSVLARIYETPERPRCMCIRGGLEMYIAKHRFFIVKRMPETGSLHSPMCPSYEPEAEVSGLGELIGGAVINRSPECVELRVDFPLARARGRTMGERQRPAPGDVSTSRQRMSLRAVMHFLFERAGLNRWYPAMAGKRNQGVLHKYLTEAAEEVTTKGLRLSERLYVPEPFSESTYEQTAERRRRKLAVLKSGEDAQQLKMALVLGEFKGSESADIGRKLWIKHMPDAPLLIDTKAWERIVRLYGGVFQARDADTMHKPRVVVGALIYAKAEHMYQVDTASFMLTTDQWIPIDGLHEIDLISRLVEQKRRFIKPLRYDAISAAVFPNALLLDAGDRPVPLHVVSPFSDPKERAAKEKVLKANNQAVWIWHTTASMPPLPGATTSKPKQPES
jgi:hypothetical protein